MHAKSPRPLILVFLCNYVHIIKQGNKIHPNRFTKFFWLLQENKEVYFGSNGTKCTQIWKCTHAVSKPEMHLIVKLVSISGLQMRLSIIHNSSVGMHGQNIKLTSNNTCTASKIDQQPSAEPKDTVQKDLRTEQKGLDYWQAPKRGASRVNETLTGRTKNKMKLNFWICMPETRCCSQPAARLF